MKLLVYILAASLSICHSCGEEEECHETITFINQSETELYVTSSTEYPDTMNFAFQPNPTLDSINKKVQSLEINDHVLWGRGCLELVFKDRIASDTLMIYVFDSQVLESMPWDTVISQHLILKRYDLSLDDLGRLDWTITYP